jgi:hypothetical protein
MVICPKNRGNPYKSRTYYNADQSRTRLIKFNQKLISTLFIQPEDISYTQEMDTNGSDSLDYGELCSQLRRFQFKPRIHLTISDYDVITRVSHDLWLPYLNSTMHEEFPCTH